MKQLCNTWATSRRAMNKITQNKKAASCGSKKAAGILNWKSVSRRQFTERRRDLKKTFTIKLTANEHAMVCLLLDKGWDYCADGGYFDSETEKDEYFAALEKVCCAKPDMVQLVVPFSPEEAERIKLAAKEIGFKDSNELILHVITENLKNLKN